MTKIDAVRILEKIKADFVREMQGDPLISKVCNVIIHEFQKRADDNA